MKLSDFIEAEIEAILTDWETFARTRLPAAEGLSSDALRDHARTILLAVAADIRTDQCNTEQAAKSQGLRPKNAPRLTDSAREHARDRLDQGFTLDQLVSEFRALRAGVMRLWSARLSGVGHHEHFDELIRFNEALDQALTESSVWYGARLQEARDLLLGMLGHDLRNPLGAARSSAIYLLRAEGLDGDQTKAADRILNSTTRMRQLIEDLLDFTRTRLGPGLPIAPHPAQMGKVCQQVVDELSAFHPEHRVDLDVGDVGGDLDGRWDVQRIAQMLSNLGANAIQYGDPGKAVLFTARGDDENVVVQVHNHGPAIAADVQQRLFEPMRRAALPEAEQPQGSSGLGLGLYIARQIAVAHGGSIEVVSSESEGTTFTVRLPRMVPAGDTSTAASG